jgi:2'-5' RNA ligase
MTKDGKTCRLFVGIALDDVVRERCAKIAEAVRSTGFDGRYEASEKYHITLAFLGNVAPERMGEVEATMCSLSHIATSHIVLDRLGGFPHERRPRVAFIGARNQGSAFAHLATQACALYAALGFTLEKDPVAHVTIARVKAPQCPLPLVDVAPIPVEISALTLFESLPDRANNTSRYEIRRTIALATPT